jgi:hypothetical protein
VARVWGFGYRIHFHFFFRLNRALEEIDKYKSQLKDLKTPHATEANKEVRWPQFQFLSDSNVGF